MCLGRLNIPRDYFYGSNDFTIRGRIVSETVYPFCYAYDMTRTTHCHAMSPS